VPRTLTHKLVLTGAGLLLGVAIAAAFIITNVLLISTAVDHLTNHTVTQVELSGQFNANIFRSIVKVESFVRNRDPADRAEALRELQEARTTLDQLNSGLTSSDAFDQGLHTAQTDLQHQRVAVFAAVEPKVLNVLQAAERNDTTAVERSMTDLTTIETNVEMIEERSADLTYQSTHDATAAVNTVIQHAIVMAVGLFGLFALAVLGLLLFMRQTIVRPIARLSAVARTVADGDLDHTIAITSHDEIGSLQAAFNHMINNLRIAGETTAEYQRTLEARVAERTTALAAVNHQLQLELAERIRAETALREREAYFRALIEQSADPIALFVDDGTIVYCSPAITHILGYPIQELVGRNVFDLIHPEDRPQVTQQLTLVARQPNITLRARVQHADGSWRDMEGTFTNLLDDPAVGAIVSNFRDVTERNQMAAALEEERASLARRVEERTADLTAANVALEHAAGLKDEFLASMSHELRTPLNTILGMAETVQEGVFGTNTAEQANALHHIEESGRHLLALINDILDLSKVEAGKLDLQIEDVPSEQMCQASLRLVKQSAHQKRLTVSSQIDSAVTMLQVDARRLKQMLVNLLSNAIKFTPEGGAIGLDVVGDAEAQRIHLTIWDTGIGMAADDLPRLFQPFVQLDSRLARQYNGTGLGLALVQRMAALHGGSVAVESTLGQGSRFTITLPWTATPPTADSVATVDRAVLPAADRAPIQRALIIEDSSTAATQLARYLGELGAEARVHPHGVGALEVALEVCPDVILLDIQLPDISGWDVLAQLKADPRLRAIPVVVVSVVDDLPRGMALGADAYLVKPIARQQLQEVLATIASRAAAQPEPSALPLAPDAPQAPPAPVILLAEDEENNIYTLSTYLTAKGYQVVVARNGAEALERAHAVRPALIVMDIQMPGMDGLEATRRIRADATFAAIPIIALTALAMAGDRERCLAAGADDYLSKPVSMKGLVATIDTHLHRAAMSLETANDRP
jgi:PAS domain S-box-containing protein